MSDDVGAGAHVRVRVMRPEEYEQRVVAFFDSALGPS